MVEYTSSDQAADLGQLVYLQTGTRWLGKGGYRWQCGLTWSVAG